MAKKETAKETRTKIFEREFKRILNTGLVTAFGIVVALAWKDVLDGYIGRIVELSPLRAKFIGAILITLLATIIIMISSKALLEKK